MIVGIIQGSAEGSLHFASMFDVNGRIMLNTDGDSMSSDWTGPESLGTTFSSKTGETTHHALVCYPADHTDIKTAAMHLTQCLDDLDTKVETVAFEMPMRQNKPLSNDILDAIARSRTSVIVYYT